MSSIALNRYLHKCFASGRFLRESTIASSSRFWMRQCEALTSLNKSAIIQLMNVIFRARNEKIPRRRQQYVIGLSRAFVKVRAAAGKGGRGSIKREAAFH